MVKRIKLKAQATSFASKQSKLNQTGLFFGLLLLFWLGSSSALHSATFYVTNLNNSGSGSFRQACSDADGNGVGIDTVDFTVSGTITLSSSVTVNSNVYIRGLGPDQNIIQANTSAGSASYRVLDFGANADQVYVVGVRVRHGNVAANGGGINSAGDNLTIQNCVIDSNYSTGNQGGGVYTSYNLTMKNCLVRGNYCQYNAGGVGQSPSANSTMTFTNVTFAGNRSNSNQANHGGGAFLTYAFNGTHVVNFMNCTFKDNFITGSYPNQGTAIHIQPFSTANYTLNIVNTLLQNTSGSNYYLYAGGGGFTLNRSYTISNDASMSVTGTGNSNSTNANLMALSDNGGSQKTFALSAVTAAQLRPGSRQGSFTWTDSDGNYWLFGGSGAAASTSGHLSDLWKYDAASGLWSWIKGSNASNQLGVYGTQGTAAASNNPGARAYGSSWIDSNGIFWLFGGTGYASSGGSGLLNDLWKYDPATNQWTWMKGSNSTGQLATYGTQGTSSGSNIPGAREHASEWMGDDGMLWMFGGSGVNSASAGILSDLWKYNPATNQWTWIKGTSAINANGTYGTQGTASGSNTPGALDGTVSWKDSSGNFWLFGGYGYPSSGGAGSTNDLWRYNPSTNQWTWMKGGNSINQGGTYGTQGTANASNTPGCRYYAASGVDVSDNLWLFSGNGYASSTEGQLNDLWKYSISTNQWTWMKGASAIAQYGTYGTQGTAGSSNTPGTRFVSNAFGMSNGKFAIHAGGGLGASGAGGTLYDLWSYDISSNQWTWLSGGNNVDQYGIYVTSVNSSAYNSGTSAGSPSDDARGFTRDGSPDIGSFEHGASVPYTTPDRAGSGFALEFDGANDYASLNPNVTLSGNFSTEFWIKTTNDSPQMLYSFGVASSTTSHSGIAIGNGWTGTITNELVSVYKISGGNFSIIACTSANRTLLFDGNWHHVTVTYDGTSTYAFYIDGVYFAPTVGSITAGYDLTIGSPTYTSLGDRTYNSSHSDFYDGEMDEVRIWDVTLSQTTIRTWMCKKLENSHTNYASLQTHFDFDDGTGTTLYDRVDTNHATLTNMATSAWVQSGAALGDESAFTYGGSAASLMNANGTEMNIDNFNGGFQGIHIYSIEDSPNNTNGFNDADTSGYFGIFKTGAGSYDVTLEYSANTGINGQSNEQEARIYKRSNNSSANWELTTGELRTRTGTNRILLPNQTGTEYVVGFVNSAYPARPGSGYALDFDDVNDHVLVPDNNAFDVSAVTIETWVYWEGASTDIDFICGKTYEEIEIQTQGTNKIRFIPTTDVYLDAPNNSFLPNRWNHVACVYDPTTSYAKIYINGVDVGFTNAGANPLSTALQTSSADFKLGMRLGGIYHFNGKMDEYRLWSTALDAATIRNWMCRKIDSTHSAFNSMVAYYRFDDGEGSTLEDLVGGLDGTLTSMDTVNAWEISGAALGDTSANTYGGSNLSLQEAGGDSILINNFDGSLNGIHLYAVNDRPFYRNFYGAESTDTNYYFGVFKVGHDTTTYDVTYYYGNSALLSGSANEYRAAVAKRDNDADPSWETQWFKGTTNTTANTVFLPEQTGTHYAGIVSANNALDFDGLNDVVQIPNSAILNSYGTTGELTIEYWVYPRSVATQQDHISKRPAANNAGFVIETNGTNLTGYAHFASGWVAANMVLTMNAWNHVAFVSENGIGVSIFKNGVLQGFGANTGNMVTTNYQLEIAAGVFGRYTDAKIDEVRILNRALCQAEIAAHANCEFDTISDTSIIAYYSFNQGVADSTNTGLDSLIDQSGNFQNGTLQNFALASTGSNWTAGSTGISGVCGPYLPAELLVTGNGVQIADGSVIQSFTDSTDLGAVVVGNLKQQVYKLYNTGVSTLNVDSILLTGPDSTQFNVVSYTASIPVGDSGTLVVEYSPSSADTHFTTVNIYSNACITSPYEYEIKGAGFYLDAYSGFGQALNFSAAGGYITAPDPGLNSTDFSLEFWIKKRVNSEVFMSNGTLAATSNNFIDVGIESDGKLYLEFWNNRISTVSYIDTAWHHIAFTADRSSGIRQVYVDGQLEATTNTAVFGGSGPFVIGAEIGFSSYFSGKLDEIRLWDYARTGSEISADYLHRVNESDTDLIAYWNFDVGIASTVLPDVSGNGFDGTIVSMAASDWSTTVDSIIIGTVSEYAAVGDSAGVAFGWRNDTSILSLHIIGGDPNGIFTIDTLSGLITVIDSSFLDYETDTAHYLQVEAIAIGYNFRDTATFVVQVQDVQDGPAGALSFDGVNDYLSIPLLSTSTQNVTFEGWIMHHGGTGSNEVPFYNGTTSSNGYGFILQSGNDTLKVLFGGVAYASTGVELADSTWYHVAIVIGSGTLSCYVNGTAVIVNQSLTPVTPSVRTTIAANQANNEGFSGKVDEVRFWNRALSANEIVSNMSCELEGSECGLWAYYNFNNDSALVGLNNAGLITVGDSTSNGNNGILQNFSLSGANSNWTLQSDSILNNCIDSPDVVAPIVVPVDTLNVWVNSAGVASIDSSLADSASCDYYSGIFARWTVPNTVNCSNDGDSIKLFVRDNAGNIDSATFIVNIIDTASPTIVARNAFVYLNNSGFALLNADSVDGGSFDGCSSIALSINLDSFTCADLTTLNDPILDANSPSVVVYSSGRSAQTFVPSVSGVLYDASFYLRKTNVGTVTRTMQLIAGDPNSGTVISSQTFSLTNSAGTLYNFTFSNPVYLIAGESYSFKFPDLTNVTQGAGYATSGANGPYPDGVRWSGAGTMVTNPTQDLYFVTNIRTANNIQQVILTATDTFSNSASDTALVLVLDTVSPTAVAANHTAYLDATGMIVVVADSLEAGSTDNCGIDSIAINVDTLYCVDTSAAINVQFTAFDASGNSNTVNALILVVDSTPPTIATQNITINLDASGNATTTASAVNNGTTDNCAIDMIWLSDSTFTCADSGANSITFFARDISGNISSGSATITVQDILVPTVTTQNITINLDATGNVTTSASAVNNGSTDNCAIDMMWLSDSTFTCADSGANAVTLFVRDISGNIGSAAATITVQDITAPNAVAQDLSVSLDATGNVSITSAGVNNGSTDNCAINQLLLDVSTFSCADTGVNVVVLTVVDVSGNIDTAHAYITVSDVTVPTIATQNVTINLDASGNATTTASAVNNGTTDNCAIDMIWLSDSTFTCADSGANSITFFARDISGNISSGSATITVQDILVPTVTTQNITINLDATGNVITSASAVNNGSTDNCAIDMMWLSDSTFTCADSGANAVTLFVRDISGNIGSAAATITVQDIIAPNAVAQDLSVSLDATGNVSITPAGVNNGSTDNCAINQLLLDVSTFSCADTGVNVVVLTVVDVSGNMDTAHAYITVSDVTAPTIATQNITINLDASGNATTSASVVNNGTTDNCAIDMIWLSDSTFTCADSGAMAITFFARDISGNISSGSATITVQDILVPTVTTQNITINLDATGNAATSASAVNNGSTDNCAIDMMWLSDSTFTCADSGANAVTLFVRDISGNIGSAAATITVQDIIAPNAVAQDLSVSLDATGNVSITPAGVNNGSTDNCAINQLLLDVSTFSCADTGVNVVVLTVVDVSGNMDTAHAYITVSDVSAPTIATQNITINLDASGNATTTASAVNNGTTDNCAIDMIWLSDSTFTCADSGANSITFFARDISGNISSGSATVTVQDIIPPTANVTNLTVYLNVSGNATLTGAAFNVGSTDNCAVASHTTSVSSFNCTHIGSPVNVVITAYDVSGNSDTAHATVTVLDTIAPTVVTQNISINLNASGVASITAAAVNNGSSDACGIATIAIDSTNFNCSEVGANTVTLTVTDIHGNVGTGSATVTVVDAINPVAIAKNYYIVFLDSFGNAALAADSIDSASSDNCTFSKTLSVSNFTCVDAGFFTPVTLTITDASGNIATDVCQVFVDDIIPPIPFTQNITVNLDATGNVGVSVFQVLLSLSDTCAIVEILVDSADSVFFDCSNTGTPIQVLVSARDTNNNIGSNLATITVVDNIDPTVVTRNLTIFLDSNGSATIDSNALDSASFDVCGIASINNSQSAFDCTDIGVNNITVTVTDVNGNPSTAVAQVTVFDTISPVAGVFQNVVRYLNAAGNVGIPTNSVRNPATSSDNCSITSARTPTNANCSNVGTPLLVVVTVTDPSGNSDTAHTYVTILDTVRPNGITQNITIQLDSNGNDTITWSQINNGSTDACGIDSIWLSDSIFNCADVGANTIQMYVRDIWNNTDTVNAVVTVQDNIDPVLFTVSDTIFLDSDGDANTTVASILDSVSDACGIASIVPSDTAFTCSDVGTNVITLTVTDNNGNVTVNNVNIVVFDTIFPTIQIANATVYLDASGVFTLDSSVIELGTFDNCAIPTYSIDSINYDCVNAFDTIIVHVTATDEHGNASIDSVQIIILDTVRPEGVAQNFTTQLDAFGNDTITWTNIENGSFDACGIDSTWLSDSIFNCSDVGANAIQMFVRDVNGNIDTVGAVVTVQDLVPPTAIGHQVVNIYLDSFGEVSITELDVDSASADACGLDTMIISQYDFICSDVGAPIAVVLTVTDVNGNVSLDTSFVNVFDTIAPLIFTQNDTVYLDSFGQVSITENDINNGSWDSCGIATISIDTFIFSCDNTTSLVPVVLTITDVYGNSDTAHAIVLVIDSIRPEIVCQADILVDNDPNQCGAIVNYPMASATDNCGIDTVYQQDTTGLFSGSLFPVGTTTVMFMAVDVNGNLDSCTLNITVIDTQSPTIICHLDTVICDSVFNFVDPITADNCSGETLVQTGGLASGSSYPVGITVNTFTVTDASGNTDSCSFTVTRDPFPDAAFAGGDSVMCNILSYSTSATPVTIGSGSWSVLSSNATILDTADATTQFDGLDIGDNEFLWTVRSGVCAPNYDTLMIKIDEFSTVATLPGDTSLCAQDELVIVGNLPSAGTGTWSISGPANLSSTVEVANSIIDMQIGSIQVAWSISNGVCPTESDSMWIYNNALPVVEAGDNFDRFPGQPVTMQPVVTNAITYLWTPSELFVDAELLNAEVSTMNSVMLKLTATSDSGCVASDSVFYFVSTLDSLPTGITPNGDNINDVWNLKALVDYPNAEVSIYDQTGRRIFQSQGYAEPFDGSVDGVPLPRASYYYVIDLKDGINKPFKGIITIIR